MQNFILQYHIKNNRQYVKHVFYMKFFIPNLFKNVNDKQYSFYSPLLHLIIGFFNLIKLAHKHNFFFCDFLSTLFGFTRNGFPFHYTYQVTDNTKQQKLVTFLVMSLLLAEYTLN